MDELLSVARLREITDESDRCWRRRIARHELPYMKLGSNVRVRRTDFEAWLESHIQPAQEAEEPSTA